MSAKYLYEKERRAIVTFLSMSVPQHHVSIVEMLHHQGLYTDQETTASAVDSLRQDGAIEMRGNQYLLTQIGVLMRHPQQ